MKQSDDDQEWVLDACPHLVSLKMYYRPYEDEDNDDSDVDIIRSIRLELPSLEKLHLKDAHTVGNCTLTCPKLADIEITGCWEMVALKFANGAQLHRLESKSRSPSQCIAYYKKHDVFMCMNTVNY